MKIRLLISIILGFFIFILCNLMATYAFNYFNIPLIINLDQTEIISHGAGRGAWEEESDGYVPICVLAIFTLSVLIPIRIAMSIYYGSINAKLTLPQNLRFLVGISCLLIYGIITAIILLTFPQSDSFFPNLIKRLIEIGVTIGSYFIYKSVADRLIQYFVTNKNLKNDIH